MRSSLTRQGGISARSTSLHPQAVSEGFSWAWRPLGWPGCVFFAHPARASAPLRRGTSDPAPARARARRGARQAGADPTGSARRRAGICREDHGRIERGQLSFAGLAAPLQFRVYLPPCYRQQVDARYPVLYLIHGQGFTDDQWERMGAGETADRLINAEVAPSVPDRHAVRPRLPAAGRVCLLGMHSSPGWSPGLILNYRTRPERAFRAIGGLSRGAAWALHLGLNHWELFGAVGGHSLPVFWADGPHLNDWLDAIPPEAMPRFYLDIGSSDGLRPLRRRFRKPAQPARASRTNGTCSPVRTPRPYWSAHLEQYLRWYAAGWEGTAVSVSSSFG